MRRMREEEAEGEGEVLKGIAMGPFFPFSFTIPFGVAKSRRFIRGIVSLLITVNSKDMYQFDYRHVHVDVHLHLLYLNSKFTTGLQKSKFVD